MDKKILAKVTKSIKIASNLLDKNSKSLNEENVEKDLWQINAELEYAASLISITSDLMDFNPNTDVPDDMNINKILTFVQNDLSDVRMLINNDPREAYEKIRIVISYIRTVQSKLNSDLRIVCN